jgi:multiple sugar transport system ATP-binding protein
MLGIESLLQRKPGELSGGQRQRVAIARALVRRPSVFLMDEPLSNLDAQLRTATRAELKRLQAEMAVTTLYVTHDQTEAMTLGDQVALLKDGRLVQAGTPEELYRHPADPFAATFIGSPPMNLIPARLHAEADAFFVELAGVRLALPERLKSKAAGLRGAQVLLGIRPEHLRPSADGRLAGTITWTEYLGRELICRLDVSGRELLFLTQRRDLQPGHSTALTFDDEDLHLFAH